MNIQHHSTSNKSKLPSIAMVAAIHALILGVALQKSALLKTKPRPETEIVIPKIEPTKPEIVEKMMETKLQPPPTIYVPIPFVPSTLDKDPVIKTTATILEPKIVDPKIDIGGTREVLILKKTVMRLAASVDANACEKPAYPTRSIQLNEEGTVNLSMLIGADGSVLESRVDKSSGSKGLDKAAIQGLSLCKFKPGSTDGVPEKSWAKLQYVWRLDQ